MPILVSFEKFFANILHLTNFSAFYNIRIFDHYWSLAVEMQFYIILPVFLYIIRKPENRIYALLSMFILFSTNLIFSDNMWMFRFSKIPLGIVVYYATTTQAYAEIAPNISLKLWPPVITTAFLFFIGVAMLAVRPLPSLGFAIANLLSAVLVFLASYQKGYISSFGVNPLVQWIGTRSYSIYLCHVPMMLFNRLLWMLILRFFNIQLTNDYWIILLVSCVILTGIASEISYRFLEKPFLRKR